MEKNTTPSMKKLQEIIMRKVTNNLDDIIEGHDLDINKEDVAFSLYFSNNSTVELKGGRTKFVKIFDKEVKMLLKNKIINLKEFGFLTYLGMTFTSFEDNILKNTDGSICTQTDIIESSGLSRSVVSPMMKKLVEKNLIYEVNHADAHRAKAYYLNPLVFYRGNKIDKKIKKIFDDVQEEVYKVWSNKDEAKKVIEDNRIAIAEAIESIINIESDLSRGIREEEDGSIRLQ
jgi:DNA-binding MarR family transcriptional regulator